MRRWLACAERFNELAIRRGLVEVKIPRSKSSALLRRVTSLDQYFFFDRRRLREPAFLATILSSTFSFEILHGSLVFLGGAPRGKRAQIPVFARTRIALPRIEPILA